MTAFNGRPSAIDFAQNTVSIRHPVTRKILTFHYETDAEDLLIRSRREWVQVRGSFELDEAGEVSAAFEVHGIEPLDLSPLELKRVADDGLVLEIDPPLVAEIRLDEETSQRLTIHEPALNLIVGAESREELEDEIARYLVFLWREFALEAPEGLTAGARVLRENVRTRLREAR